MNKDDLILYSLRYCLGKSSPIIREMINYLYDHWEIISPYHKEKIKNEIYFSISRHSAGMKQDENDWSLFLEDIEESCSSDEFLQKFTKQISCLNNPGTQ